MGQRLSYQSWEKLTGLCQLRHTRSPQVWTCNIFVQSAKPLICEITTSVLCLCDIPCPLLQHTNHTKPVICCEKGVSARAYVTARRKWCRFWRQQSLWWAKPGFHHWEVLLAFKMALPYSAPAKPTTRLISRKAPDTAVTGATPH